VQDALTVLAGRYQVGTSLGSGGFGEVFSGLDLRTNERVALKHLLRLEPYALVLFKREFRLLCDCVHPNLVKYHELINHGEQWWLVMEYVDGVDLQSHVRDDSFSGEAGSTKTVISQIPDTTLVTAAVQNFLTSRQSAATPIALTPAQVHKLRQTLPQLQEGMAYLHARGLIHRDLKPANIMVDRSGRVVVLDFGLAGRSDQPNAPTEIVGTLRYMSPEHAQGQQATAASDWYSLGVILYMMLTGVPPYVGSASEMIKAKSQRLPTDPRLAGPALPADLCERCLALLHPDPALRPKALVAAPDGTRSASSVTLPFVGRMAELTALRGHAARITTSTQGCLVLVHGASGIGKSALIQEYLADFRCKPGAVVLEGRCYEREAVPFKALDGVVDALAEHLAAQPPQMITRLLPRYAPQLAHLFPVLTSIPGIQAAKAQAAPLEPSEARRRGLLALRELLVRLGESRPLVVVIDDLQWSDDDSLAAMGAVFGVPDPPPLMVIGSCRTDHAAGGLEHIKATLGHAGVPLIELAVGPLAEDSCDVLARAALAEIGHEGSEQVLTGIRNAAHGHPLLLLELSRTGLSAGSQAPTVSGLLAGRLKNLPDAALGLLGCLAVAGRPRPLLMLRRTVRLEQGTFDAMALLRSERLVRTRAMADDEEVSLFHDQVADAVLNALTPDTTRDWHSRLLIELKSAREPELEAEALHRHAFASGDTSAAGHWALIAAGRATASLAFERAVELYRIAFTIADRGCEVRMRLADVLAAAGRGPEAAHEYRLAGDAMQGAAARHALCRAAGQYLRSGQMREGLETAHAALAVVGEKMGSTPRAMWTLTVGRWMHPPWKEPLNPNPSLVEPATVERMDALWEIAHGLGGIDTIRAAAMHARHLQLALRSGDITRSSKGLAWEAILTFALGGTKQLANGWQLVERSAGMALRLNQEHLRAWSQAAAGYGHWCEGRFTEAIDASIAAAASYREEGHDVAWELGSVMAWCLAPALAAQGNLTALKNLCAEVELEFERLGDRYTLTTMRTVAKPLLHFAAGKPELARAETSAAIDAWSREHWHLQHLFAAFAHCRADLYGGDAQTALTSLVTIRKRMATSFQNKLQIKRVFEIHLHTCALAMAAHHTGSPRKLIAKLRSEGRRLAAEGLTWASAHAQAAEAAAFSAEGRTAEAVAGYVRAADAYQALGMQLHHLAARRRAAEVGFQREPSPERVAALQAAEQQLLDVGVAEPARLVAMLVPGAAPVLIGTAVSPELSAAGA